MIAAQKNAYVQERNQIPNLLQSCKMPKHDKLKLNTIFMRLAMVWGNGVLFAEQFGSIRIVNKYML